MNDWSINPLTDWSISRSIDHWFIYSTDWSVDLLLIYLLVVCWLINISSVLLDWLINWLISIDWLIDWLIDWYQSIDWLIDWWMDGWMDGWIDRSIDRSVGRSVGRLRAIVWFSDQLIIFDWLIDWSIDWLIGLLIEFLTDWLTGQDRTSGLDGLGWADWLS